MIRRDEGNAEADAIAHSNMVIAAALRLGDMNPIFNELTVAGARGQCGKSSVRDMGR